MLQTSELVVATFEEFNAGLASVGESGGCGTKSAKPELAHIVWNRFAIA